MVTPAPVSHRTAEENLGLGYLSAILQKNGFEVKILDAWLNGWTPDELADNILQPNIRLEKTRQPKQHGQY